MSYISQIADLLTKLISNPDITSETLNGLIKPANKNVQADYAINCFGLKRWFKIDGNEISIILKNKFSSQILQENPFIQNIVAEGPYLNLILNKTYVAQTSFSQIYQDIKGYVRLDNDQNIKPQRLVIEFPSPNTNKPLHLGHIRNMLLGQVLSVLHKHIGNEVFQVNLLNNRGIHICKSMLAYQDFGNGKTPESEKVKSDHFVGQFYVKYAQEEARLKEGLEDKLAVLDSEKKKQTNERDIARIEEIEKELSSTEYWKLQNSLKEMLINWENKEPNTIALWSKLNQWAEQGFKETFQIFGIVHDKKYYESDIYDKGKEIVLDGLKKGIFEQLEDGAIVINFKQKGFPKQKVFVRSDGTTLYATQDLYLAYQKMKDFNYDQSIYVIGNEQDMQLKVIFKVLEKLGMKGNNLHYSYGMINLTTGKMKSREGTVVDADDIVMELEQLALKEIKSRYKELDEKELIHRANIIAMSALRFFILKYEYSRDFLFDPKQSISFEGETGPYLLYAYARICSIYRKADEMSIPIPFNPALDQKNIVFSYDLDLIRLLIDPHELTLIEYLTRYPDTVRDSATQLKPHTLARYLYDLCQEFTSFYHSCPILQENDELRTARIYLIEALRIVLKDGLDILGISVLNEM